MSNEWDQGPGECCNDSGLCCYTFCCPCLAFKEAADNIGKDDAAWLYCLLTFPVPFGCCSLTHLGTVVAEKAGIAEEIPMSAVKSCFDCCCCYSCTVVNQSRKIKAAGEGNQKMERE
mmetsp:Transcript_11592/g.17016  ORF Transcript_11592/g.17016 Transcript_11592/m.17016 type:complete len:117 (+) Transcript_11592:83-433(+)